MTVGAATYNADLADALAILYPDGEELTGRQTRNIDELAAILGISRRTAYRLVKEGTIPSLSLGKRKLVTVATIRGLLGETPAVNGDAPLSANGPLSVEELSAEVTRLRAALVALSY